MTYVMLMLPALLLAGVASLLTQGTFERYARVRASSGLTGAQAARLLLDTQGLGSVRIEPSRGFLSDHYDPVSRTLRLSPAVYGSASLSAIGVACHEAGHALQHATLYAPLALRSALVPVTQLGSNLSWFLLLGGLLLNWPGLILAGVALFSLAVVFALVTLPVEWNASSRAKDLMVRAGIVTAQERPHAAAVLNAAFLTYVASAVSAILTLLYYLLRFGLLGRRSD
jgi:hypothetical protein